MQDFESLPPEIEMQIRAKLSYREYETRGDLNALDLCIQSARLVMDMTEDDSPEKADTLTNLAMPDRKSTRLNSSHSGESRMPSSA